MYINSYRYSYSSLVRHYVAQGFEFLNYFSPIKPSIYISTIHRHLIQLQTGVGSIQQEIIIELPKVHNM